MQFAFLCIGIFIHLLLLYAIFDIYYSSPIVKGARSFPIVQSSGSAQAPADRLVFFSADGLRASAFFNNSERSPFLHGVIRDGKAAWGVSQSHVPTESRPGHVALMAGFYEDVSAVTHGWKHNPVPFDSTLNQSAQAFLWGSPDIVHLFSTTIPHADAEVYAPELEDFASADAAQLDEWVFQRVEHFFHNAKDDPKQEQILTTKRSIFFLHLLGLDTNGHGHKPRSEQYLANIRTVDNGVRRVVQLFEQHYSDNRTAYLFTADHGMTDWGSHGDGTPDEVQTPFVAWGAGISPTKSKNGLELAQVDMATLQSALIGTAIPVNSFGILPVELVDATAKYRFQAAYANFKQMSEQFTIRRAERRAHSFKMFFTECPTLRFDGLAKIESEILRLAQLKRYEAAWKACIKWIPLIREALNYFHGYHRFSQGIAIGALFCAWNFVLYASVIGKYQHLSLRQLYTPNALFNLLISIAAFLVWAQGLPMANYLYFLTPIFLLSLGTNMLQLSSREFLDYFYANARNVKLLSNVKMALVLIGLAASTIALLVWVFFERSILSVIFAAISPFWFLPIQANKGNNLWRFGWLFLCLTLAIFPLLDTVGNSPQPGLVICAEAICCALLWVYQRRAKFDGRRNLPVECVQKLHLIGLALLISVDFILGPNMVMRIFAWLSIPAAILLPFWMPIYQQIPKNVPDLLILWSASLQLPFMLLSLGHEALFLCAFSALLFIHVRMERGAPFWTCTLEMNRRNNTPKKDALLANGTTDFGFGRGRVSSLESEHGFSTSEWLRAFFLVICIQMAFFGTGNIASLNSFNPSFLRHFLSLFSPFTMAGLLLLKVFIPFLAVSIHFVAAMPTGNGQQQIGLARLATLVGLITNTMAMVFFYCLRTDGSWLQIGISISNYVICLVCSGATYFLLHLSHFLLYF